MQGRQDPAEAGRILLAKAGLGGRSPRVTRLSHGKNNLTYRLDAEGTTCLLKQYFRHPRDMRDRQGAELAFLSFCQKNNIASVPIPLAYDRIGRWSLFSWLDGRPAAAEDITRRNVALVGAFLRDLAEAKSRSEDLCLQPAAEACFSLLDHITLAKRRVERLLHGVSRQRTCPLALKAEEVARRELLPGLEREEERLARRYGQAGLRARFTWEEMVPSPSDIGFHNILVMTQGLGFVDFEYAGIDDAAKMLCDFLCQPSLPVPAEFLKEMRPLFGGDARAGREIYARAEDVLVLHRIKWCCILLNVFDTADAERRLFSGSAAEVRALREMQLKKCVNYICRYLKRTEHGIH